MKNKFYGDLYLLGEGHRHTCTKTIKNNDGWGNIEKWTCGKPAVYGTKNGLNFFCKHHSLMGRYVIRVGDVGEILARFDTEEEMKTAYHSYPQENKRMQRLSKSHRRDIH